MSWLRHLANPTAITVALDDSDYESPIRIVKNDSGRQKAQAERCCKQHGNSSRLNNSPRPPEKIGRNTSNRTTARDRAFALLTESRDDYWPHIGNKNFML